MARSHWTPLASVTALVSTAVFIAGCSSGSLSPAPTAAPVAETPSASATGVIPIGGGVPVSIGGYAWTAGVDKPGITAQTTITWGTGQGDAGQPLNSPPGYTYLLATITLTNSSDRVEPGLEDVGDTQPQPATPFEFVIEQGQASTAGLTVKTFTASDWPLLDGTPPPGPQCAFNGDPSAMYGGYCALRSGDAAIAQATPETGAPVSPPQIAPGGSQQVTIFVGAPQKVSVTAIRLVADGQGADNTGFTLLP
ncbi:MAG: hypothetical protein ACYDAN_12010 [Candidatus Limnocylindrales bacterium]